MLNKSIWTLAEQNSGYLKSISYELLSRGRTLADKLKTELCSVVLGAHIDKAGIQELIYRGADKVYLVESPALEHFLVEPYSNVMEYLIRTHKPS
ncbi:electron transfer flavoprotein subunit alpha, partial [Candidatus Poribacteria bacterium]|nr:electron transfer flavoprotein subunit alpha [Candidatus Poribacteria bacterium]